MPCATWCATGYVGLIIPPPALDSEVMDQAGRAFQAAQRAAPPATRPLLIDETMRNVSPFTSKDLIAVAAWISASGRRCYRSANDGRSESRGAKTQGGRGGVNTAISAVAISAISAIAVTTGMITVIDAAAMDAAVITSCTAAKRGSIRGDARDQKSGDGCCGNDGSMRHGGFPSQAICETGSAPLSTQAEEPTMNQRR